MGEVAGGRTKHKGQARGAAFAALVLAAGYPGTAAGGPGASWRDARYGFGNYEGHAFPPRSYHASIAFDGKMWVIGGVRHFDVNVDGTGVLVEVPLGDIWHSSDGSTWIQAVANAPFGARSRHRCLVHDGRIWLIGGNDGAPQNDVWWSPDGVTWNLATEDAAFAASDHLAALVHDGVMWVFDGISNGAWRSTDGAAWDAVPQIGELAPLPGMGAAFHEGRFWLVGAGLPGAYWSLDGMTWDYERTCSWSPGGSCPSSLQSFAGNLWCLADYWGAGTVGLAHPSRSSDGECWSTDEPPAPFVARRGHSTVIFDDKLWVLGGGTFHEDMNDVWASVDGVSWENASGPPSFSIGTVRACESGQDGIWLLVERNSSVRAKALELWHSADGATWRMDTANCEVLRRDFQETVIHDGRLWRIGGRTGTTYFADVVSTRNGSEWTEATASAPFGARMGIAAASFEGKLWAIGGTNGTTRFNDVWQTTDGSSWTLVTASAAFSARSGASCFAHQGRLWLVGGHDGTLLQDVWSSADGVEWIQHSNSIGFSTSYSSRSCIAAAGRLWATARTNAGAWDIRSSVDGVSWTSIAALPDADAEDMHPAAIGGEFCLVVNSDFWSDYYGGRCDVWTTMDGAAWTQRSGELPCTRRTGFSAAAFNEKLWLVGGFGEYEESLTDVFSSGDGIRWTEEEDLAPFDRRAQHLTLVHDNKLWLVGGSNFTVNPPYPLPEPGNDVWWTSDGENWTEATSNAAYGDRYGQSCVSFDGKLWVIGGSRSYGFPAVFTNDVWYSEDGANWTQATESAPFSPRMEHASVVHDGRIWVIGGRRQDYSPAGDVWSSEDGAAWSQVATSLPFYHGIRPGAASFGNRLIVASSAFHAASGADYGAIWSSVDGLSWERETPASLAPGYDGAVLAAMDDTLFALGGYYNRASGWSAVYLSKFGPRVSASVSSLDFGVRLIGAKAGATLAVTLANPYPAAWEPIMFGNVHFRNDPTGAFSFAEPPDLSPVLVGDSRTFSIAISPAKQGTATAELVIETNDPFAPEIVVSLSGEGSPTVPVELDSFGVE